MTIKQKSEEIYKIFSDATVAYDSGDHSARGIKNSIIVMEEETKRCSLIAVKMLADNSDTSEKTNYWCAVKAEIERL